jgi:hypothetical protein
MPRSAPFIQKTDAEYDIIIEPKMSFGTGHETTHDDSAFTGNRCYQ